LYLFKIKHEFAKKFLRYNLPYHIDNTPKLVAARFETHSYRGFANYVRNNLFTKIC